MYNQHMYHGLTYVWINIQIVYPKKKILMLAAIRIEQVLPKLKK